MGGSRLTWRASYQQDPFRLRESAVSKKVRPPCSRPAENVGCQRPASCRSFRTPRETLPQPRCRTLAIDGQRRYRGKPGIRSRRRREQPSILKFTRISAKRASTHDPLVKLRTHAESTRRLPRADAPAHYSSSARDAPRGILGPEFATASQANAKDQLETHPLRATVVVRPAMHPRCQALSRARS